jgi:FkbM family methyltransferase
MKIISRKLRIKFLERLLHRYYKINVPDRLKCRIYEGIVPIHAVSSEVGEFKLYCPSDMVFYRARSFFTKEPETVEWIRSFAPGETLFDLGANVGLFSLLAARLGVHAVAFEPEPQNFSVLTRNIYLNGLADLVVPLNLAIADKTTIDFLYMPVFGIGNAFNQFGVPIATGAASSPTASKQYVMAFTLDDFLSMFPRVTPTHIKIDVDGLEHLVIAGADKTLELPSLKSLLVEFDSRVEEGRKAVDIILSKGFEISSRHQRIEDNFHNYIFKRP